MTSKALFLSKVAPRLWHRHSVGSTSNAVEIWTTTCIVMNFGQTTDADCSVLINPANPQLTGVAKFPYFPKGGPVPTTAPAQFEHHIMGHVSKWGGMEVGHGMLFPVSVVDGLVHTYGGWHLQMALQWHRLKASTSSSCTAVRRRRDACPIGTAVRTTAGKEKLRQTYEAVIHTAPPFYHYPEETSQDDNAEDLLHACYKSALDQVEPHETRVATPLLGAGCRGFPLESAMDAAVQATREWCLENENRNVTVAFGLLEETWAKQMMDLLNESAE